MRLPKGMLKSVDAVAAFQNSFNEITYGASALLASERLIPGK